MKTNNEFALRTTNRKVQIVAILMLGIETRADRYHYHKEMYFGICVFYFLYVHLHMRSSGLSDTCYRNIDLSLSLSLFGLSDVCPVLQI